MTEDQGNELVSSGMTFLHSHPTIVTHDQYRRLQQLENVVFVTGNYACLLNDDIVFVTANTPVTITLPQANAGQHIVISRIAGASNVTVLPTGTDTINGAASLVISTSNTPRRLKAVRGTGYLEI